MSAHTAEELIEQPTAEEVNADNYGDQGPISDDEAPGLSPLSLPASASSEEELEAAYHPDTDSEVRHDEFTEADPSP